MYFSLLREVFVVALQQRGDISKCFFDQISNKKYLRAWYAYYNPESLARQADLFTSQSWMSETLAHKNNIITA